MLVAGGQYPVFGANGIIGHYDHYNHVEPELLMTCRGATCGTINVSLPYSWINGNAMVIHPINDDVYFDYLKYHLQTLDLSTIITGAAQPQITRQSLVNVPVKLPSIEEQIHIAKELDLLTSIIDKKNAQLRDLDALAQSIFYEMFGNNMSFWPSYKLGDICDTTSGGTPSKSHPEYYLNGTIPWLRSGEVEGTNITDTEIKITDLGVKYSSAKWFPAQTVVVAMYGATVGEVGILGKPMTTNQAVCGILPNDSLRPLYLYSWFRSKKSDFVEQATGGAQPNISQNIIRNAKICCPPLDVQDSYVERLASIEEKKMIIDCSLKQIQFLLDSRMDHYFNE